MTAPAIVWFRRDLRLQDNPALNAALARGGAVIPLFVWGAEDRRPGCVGAAGRWWLQHSLAALGVALAKRGSKLVLRRGAAAAVVGEVVRESGAGAVFWNRGYEPAERAGDAQLGRRLRGDGVEVATFGATLLHEPDAVANREGRPFQVFGAFWRHCLALPVPAPVVLPPGPISAPRRWPASRPLDSLGLLAAGRPSERFGESGTPGEAAAKRRLATFVRRAMADYDRQRDLPAIDGTSRLSAALHFGEVSPRQVWAAVRRSGRETGLFPPSRGARVFLAELGWREFAAHLLYHFPHTVTAPLRAQFARFPWAPDRDGRMLAAWQEGQTGYPMVDAGLRQLRATGWMHNRVRMIVASFLTKHLRLSWTRGAEWFASRLVDADLANNTLGWQWAAGCGADAAPYFRIFAPVLQGRKFDPTGEYVRQWVPELGRLPARWIHAPWEAPAGVLAAAGVRLGADYPRPVVDHATARREALAAFQKMCEMSPR